MSGLRYTRRGYVRHNCHRDAKLETLTVAKISQNPATEKTWSPIKVH